jgi:hypothetical protein
MFEMENQGTLDNNIPVTPPSSIFELVGEAVGHFMAIDDIDALSRFTIATDLVPVLTIRPPLPLFSPSVETCPGSSGPDVILKQSCQVVSLSST